MRGRAGEGALLTCGCMQGAAVHARGGGGAAGGRQGPARARLRWGIEFWLHGWLACGRWPRSTLLACRPPRPQHTHKRHSKPHVPSPSPLPRSTLRVFGAAPAVQEEALGLLAALTLRMPAIATAAADAGAVEAIMQTLEAQAAAAAAPGAAAAKLQQHAAAGNGNGNGAGAAGVARQACMALRNMVVRNPELRAPFLERGAEALVRGAKARHAALCGDVGSAALRDLGLDQYQ